MVEAAREKKNKSSRMRYFFVVTFVSVADDAKLNSDATASEGRAILQKDLNRQEEWTSKNCMKFIKDKYKVLHLG